MMNNISSFLRRTAGLLVLAALGVASVSSCDIAEISCDDSAKKDLTPLSTPQPRLVSATVSSLTFAWDKVADAVQYGYQLIGPDGSSVDGGTTSGTSAVIEGLRDNVTYTFQLSAFAEATGSSLGTSAIAELQCATGAIQPLGKPVLSIETGDGTATISWEAVENADSYGYSYIAEEDTAVTGETSNTSLTLNLASGSYTLTLWAQSEDEAYSDSEKATAQFDVVRNDRDESWSVKGTVDDGAGNTWKATMVAWSDGSYTIRDWYNVEGYDLEFYVNDDGSISVANYYEDYYPNIWVESGDDTDNGWVQLYTTTYGSDYYSYFLGNQKGGNVMVYNYRTSNWYTFSWPSTSSREESWSVKGTVDDGAGNKWEAILVAWKDGTYTIEDWYNVTGYDFDFTVNADKSITAINCYASYLPAVWIGSGDSVDSGWVKIYTDGGYSSFTGNKSAGGEVWFYSYRTSGYYDFVWESSGGEEGGLTVDDIVGTYAQNSTGEQIFDGYNWTAFTSTNDVTITKVDDTTVTVTGIMKADYSLTAKFDAAAATLTFEPQAWLDWYVFCTYNAPTTSVTANINDGVITLSDWTAYYTEYSYSYVWSAKTVLTKK